MALILGLLSGAFAAALGLLPRLSFAAGGSWVDLGAGCCVGSGQGGVEPFAGWLSDCLEVCQAECIRLGPLCGRVNHGWVHHGWKSTWCSVVLAGADFSVHSGPTDCGSCGDCGVHCYEYQANANATPMPAGSWTDLGAGCCTPYPEGHVLYEGGLSESLEVCQAKCKGLGVLCGYINHGWVHHGKASAWCSVLPALQEIELISGPHDCGSCGDCGVRCYRYELPTPAGTWRDVGAGCCVPQDPCDILWQGELTNSLSYCQSQCASFGELCGWVNHGWVLGGRDSSLCSVISVKSVVSLSSGSQDCGSCGDCGVHCWAFTKRF